MDKIKYYLDIVCLRKHFMEKLMDITKIFETAKDTDERISPINLKERTIEPTWNVSCSISIDSTLKFQKFHGFGGALTESVGYVLSKLPQSLREEVLKANFSNTTGNGYVFGRTHINSCDFSLENWACVEKKDETLNSFSMKRPEKYIIPTLNEANEILKKQNSKLALMVTPWSPPVWMKDNNDMNHGGHLLKEYRELWAKYCVRYLVELRNRGFDTTYLSVQNEPQAVQPWDSCIWSAEEEGEFVVNYLKPALLEAGFANTKVLVWDHNRDLMAERFEDSMKVKGATEAISGIAYHWYMGSNYQNVSKIAKSYPNKDLVFSEGCIEGGPRNGAWFTGERYAHNIINDLNNGCNTWIDWNIVLNMEGGPNHANNMCDAPILADTDKGKLNYQSSYYYIGQFSRFIKPEAVRIGCTMTPFMTPATVDGIMEDYMESTAFQNPDESITLVVSNRTEADMKYLLKLNGRDEITLSCPPRAIQTLLIRI